LGILGRGLPAQICQANPGQEAWEKSQNLFKYGLTYMASVLLNAYFQDDIGVFKFLSYT
jgi:hypothetical protein